jgi:hypothetical protein
MWLLLQGISRVIRIESERVNVQVALNVGGLDLGGQGKSVKQELAHGGGSGSLLINDRLNVTRNTVNHRDDFLNRTLQRLNVRGNASGALLGILGVGNGLETALVGLAVSELVGDGNEGGAVGSTLSGNTHGGGNVGAGLEVLSRLGGNSQVDSGVRPCAVTLAAVKVLDQGGEGVELGRGGVPTDEDLAGVGLQVQGEHLLVVLHVDFDLVLGFRVAHGERGAHLNLTSIFRSRSEQSSNNTFLVGVAAKRVVEDREDGLRG